MSELIGMVACKVWPPERTSCPEWGLLVAGRRAGRSHVLMPQHR